MRSYHDPGVMVVSIDVEMEWGRVHHGEAGDTVRHFDRERSSVAAVLRLLDRYEVSATWAVVGHLFLAQCEPINGVHHPEVRRAPYPWFAGDWFGRDPATSVDQNPRWYAPDLVEAIKECPVPQEIGSHSFSHQIIGDPACDPDTFRSELAASRAAATSAGIQLRSFVYPRNSIDHVAVLAEDGFAAYRGSTPTRFAGRSPLWRRILGTLDSMVPTAGTAVHPLMEGELCNVPQTYFFDPDSRLARRLGAGLWSRVISRRLNQAARTGSLFHLWFHSHDIAAAPERAMSTLEHLFQAANRERSAGRLVNLTMSEVAERMSDASPVDP